MGMLYEYDEVERRVLASGLRVIDDGPEEPLTPGMARKIVLAWERMKAWMPPAAKGGKA